MAEPRMASERLFFNADKTKVVAESDPEARILIAGEGGEIGPEFDDLDIPAKFLAGAVKKADKPDDKAAAKAANK